ncbi:MAG: AraC family transcriptional regulator [Verrucomicrobia bacterium]|nr:AraC family transcriptional regulator [Verrucomicrobiota bacterium]
MPEILKNISRVNLQMRRGAVVFGEVVYAPGGICGPRIQQDYQIVIVHQGELDLRLDDRRIEVAAHHAILLSPGHREHFCFARTQETRHSWCSIDAAAVPAKLRRSFRAANKPAPVDARIEALMELGKTTFFEGRPGTALENTFHLNLGLALLAGFALGVQARIPALNPGDQALLRAEHFLAKKFGQPLSLAHTATAAGVSRQHLLKLFRLRRGNTPTQYLYERRLCAAADQLAHTGLSIKEIAGHCGFANEFHFSRKFKEAYGKSPRAWRSQKWSGGN